MNAYQPLSAGPLILSRDQMKACQRIHHTLSSIDLTRLNTMIEGHVAELESRAHFDPAIDVDLGKLLAEALTGALAAIKPSDAQRWDWLRTAVGYFTRADDAYHDTSELGLNDDALVVAAILEYCELPELSKLLREYLA